MYLILGLVGGLLGASQFSIGALLFGVLLGLLVAEVLSLRKRLSLLEKTGQPEEKVEKTIAVSPEEFVPPPPPPSTPASEESAEPFYRTTHIVEEITEETILERESFLDRLSNLIGGNLTRFCDQIKQFFTSGNLVLKMGVVILFFGVSFLLKYAAQRNMIPLEFRLMGVALGGMAMLGLGWWLRRSRAGYGLVMQGGGVGVLYLVVFAAAKLYSFLPMTLALGVMIGLVTLSCMLAVFQNSKSLAIFGIVGGFLAPVLMSTGEGSHVLLFSYYALLNAGILAIAWFKAWRELNLLGFIFTFAIGTFWGSSGYRPEHFGSTEPFLILFFVFYVLISILFAHRQPVNLRGYIDGPLVFGLPLVVSGLQYCLVKDFQYGMAFSALGLGLFYLTIATVLWRRLVHSMHLLCEAFLALGVVFGSLAIPLALDGYWSGSIWALEGAGMVWVGVRQNRLLARHFGLLLQLAAAYIFVDSVWYPFDAFPFANRHFLGCLFLSLAALFSSYYLDVSKIELKKWERYYPLPLMIWGLLWWYVGGLREVDRQMPTREEISGFLLFCSASSIIIGLTIEKLHWPRLNLAALLQLPAMVLLVLLSLINLHPDYHLFRGWGAVAWTIGFIVQYRILHSYAGDWGKRSRDYWHVGSMWLALFVTCHEIAWWVGRIDGLAQVWSVVVWALIPCGLLMTVIRLGRGLSWPLGKYSSAYLGVGCIPVVLWLCCWLVGSFSLAGAPAPLPYIPLLNPLEIVGVVSLLCTVLWTRALSREGVLMKYFPEKESFWALGVLLFVWLNCVVARSVHFFADVPYTPVTLYHSVVFQAALAALWGGGALAITVWATRKGSRSIWGVGAVLLAMVVIKLLLVDLSGTGTIARIVSFLVVGVLMLIIGYLSPLPPKQEESSS